LWAVALSGAAFEPFSRLITREGFADSMLPCSQLAG
jgi:hypothetical protein